jgi:hypothetical protein
MALHPLFANVTDPVHDLLSDLMDNINRVEFNQWKLTRSPDDYIKIEAVADTHDMTVEANLGSKYPELATPFAMINLDVLNGWLQLPAMKLQYNYHPNGILAEIVFTSAQQNITYKTTPVEMISLQTVFKNKWTTTTPLTTVAITGFLQQAKVLVKTEDYFWVNLTPNGDLTFNIGKNNKHQNTASYLIAQNVSGSLDMSHEFNLKKTMKLLKLAATKNPVIAFSDIGGFSIQFDTDYANYRYILPAYN